MPTRSTILPQDMARITVYPDRRKSVIDARLYGLHLEHIWDCVYGSVWVGPESDIPNTDGIRNDVVGLLKQLRPSVCKYPGGYFSDFYDWRDGVGPREQRPTRPYPCEPGRIETNPFGTGEFVQFCRLIGAEPFFSVNTTHLTPRDAAHWVEYCNVEGGTYWSDRRISDGYPEPFNVKYWAIGNEQYWLHPARDYAHIFKLWSHWMYNTDPGISLVMSGMEPGLEGLNADPYNTDGEWADELLRLTRSGNSIFPATWHASLEQRHTLYSIHPYFSSEPFPDADGYCGALKELHTRLNRAISQTVDMLDKYRGEGPRPQLCFDEYGLIHPGTRMDGNMTQPAPYWAAIWLASFLHICHQHSDKIGMATHPGPVNMEHELVLVDGDTAIATPSYYAFKMLREHGGRTSVETVTEGLPISEKLGSEPLSVSASVDESGRSVVVTAINLDPERDTSCLLSLEGPDAASAQCEMLSCKDRKAVNTFEDPERVTSEQVQMNVGGAFVVNLPACSIVKFSVVLA